MIAISPSTYKDGIVRITQGWPDYYKNGKKDGRHWGIDIVCGYVDRDHPTVPKMVCIEDSIVINIREGNEKTSGKIEMVGINTGLTVIYKHIGSFTVRDMEDVFSGQIVGAPNFTNTKSLHLHMEVWNDEENLNPLDYLFEVQPELKYELSTSFGMMEYYKKEMPEYYEKLMKRAA